MNYKSFKYFFFILIFLLPLLIPQKILATDQIRVSGFDGTRNRHILSPLYWAYTDRLYYKLVDSSFFSSSGTVSCSVNFSPYFSEVTPLSLVDLMGNLETDIFFAGTTNKPITATEAEELKRFLEKGGIVYISAYPNPEDSGLGYNPLFEYLGLIDRFYESTTVLSNNTISQSIDTDSETFSGPFGKVNNLVHKTYRDFVSFDTTTPTIWAKNGGILLKEIKYGKGLLVVSSSHIYTNFFTSYYNGNLIYFLNLFALPCKTEEPAVVLDVPSFKQTDSLWQNTIYDDGNKQSLWCGSSIGNCGCAMTSASMVINYYGINKDSFGNMITPFSLNNYFSQNSQKIGDIYKSWGYFFGNFNWYQVDNYTALAKKVNQTQPELDQPVREDFDLEKVKQYINDQKPVILRVFRPGGFVHWVVVIGYQGDNLIINDPFTQDTQDYQTLASLNYTPDILGSMIIYKTTNSDFRSLEFFSTSEFNIDTPDGSTLTSSFEPEVESTGESGSFYLSIPIPKEGKYKINSPERASVIVDSSDMFGNFFTYIFSNNQKFNYIDQDKLQVAVNIDIRPNNANNILNFDSNMIIPVSILSNEYVNPQNIDKSSLKFGKYGIEYSLKKCLNNPIDLNFDNQPDLICLFDLSKTDLSYLDQKAYLSGQTTNNLLFLGTDDIITMFH